MAVAEMDSVYRMAFHLARNSDEASDLVQETYLRAIRAEKTFELRERGIRPWLFKILHNVFYTHVGKKKRAPIGVEDLQNDPAASVNTDPMDAPAWDLQSMNWEQVDDRLKQAIEELPEHYRSVVLLWAIEGLKYREVAEVLDVPLGTVMSRLYRARGILAEQLTELAAEAGIDTNQRETASEGA